MRVVSPHHQQPTLVVKQQHPGALAPDHLRLAPGEEETADAEALPRIGRHLCPR
ncbi:hypothetical protein [Demequina litorisediminis]|uniref:hypothetical protein n=1 Tax=Demequina litorisediminis TaxID=1849022 RepID=UPI0024E06C9F|nr:hypothetical protein [Demequina litorisediminis]